MFVPTINMHSVAKGASDLPITCMLQQSLDKYNNSK